MTDEDFFRLFYGTYFRVQSQTRIAEIEAVRKFIQRLHRQHYPRFIDILAESIRNNSDHTGLMDAWSQFLRTAQAQGSPPGQEDQPAQHPPP